MQSLISINEMLLEMEIEDKIYITKKCNFC